MPTAWFRLRGCVLGTFHFAFTSRLQAFRRWQPGRRIPVGVTQRRELESLAARARAHTPIASLTGTAAAPREYLGIPCTAVELSGPHNSLDNDNSCVYCKRMNSIIFVESGGRDQPAVIPCSYTLARKIITRKTLVTCVYD